MRLIERRSAAHGAGFDDEVRFDFVHDLLHHPQVAGFLMILIPWNHMLSQTSSSWNRLHQLVLFFEAESEVAFADNLAVALYGEGELVVAVALR